MPRTGLTRRGTSKHTPDERACQCRFARVSSAARVSAGVRTRPGTLPGLIGCWWSRQADAGAVEPSAPLVDVASPVDAAPLVEADAVSLEAASTGAPPEDPASPAVLESVVAPGAGAVVVAAVDVEEEAGSVETVVLEVVDVGSDAVVEL
jgi:hypothetical protein